MGRNKSHDTEVTSSKRLSLKPPQSAPLLNTAQFCSLSSSEFTVAHLILTIACPCPSPQAGSAGIYLSCS